MSGLQNLFFVGNLKPTHCEKMMCFFFKRWVFPGGFLREVCSYIDWKFPWLRNWLIFFERYTPKKTRGNSIQDTSPSRRAGPPEEIFLIDLDFLFVDFLRIGIPWDSSQLKTPIIWEKNFGTFSL